MKNETKILSSVSVENKSTQKNSSSCHVEAGHLESLGILAGSVIHDLNNILTGILGHVSFLKLSSKSGNIDIESLTAIEEGAKRAAALTHSVLDFAKGEGRQDSSFDLSKMVRESLNIIRATIPNNVSIETKTHDGFFINGNEEQIHQLITNLAINAKDALPSSGGMISIEVGEVSLLDPELCSNYGIEQGDYVTLSITDNGIGIPEEIRRKIFEPFFTTKGVKGTGLGLATVLAIVRAHKGSLFVDSLPGRGSTFTVVLPKNIEANLVDFNDTNSRSIATGIEKILVVEDEDAVRTVIQKSLEHLGYEVVVAVDGIDALEKYSRHSGGFQLVIADMIMPRMSGDELFYQLKSIDELIPILIASGYASDSRTSAVLRDGAAGFIQKPFAIEDLAQIVRQCIDKSISMNTKVA
jgi:two-component system, cell cycle sensor histidine kinase and response regulator CckA